MHNRLKQAAFAYFRRNWFVYLVVTVFFAAGVIFGALAVKNLNIDQIGELSSYLNSFLDKIGDTSIGNRPVKQVLTENLYMLGALYILGLSVIGLPLIPVIVFTRGFIIGFTVGFLAREKAVKGLVFAFVSLIPQNFLLIPATIVAAALSVNVSLAIVRNRLAGPGYSLLRPAGIFTVLMLMLGLVAGLAGLCETYVTPVFIKMAAGYLL
ncbi:MAG: stage II sporulation protein M [Bacillota bacterium]